MNQGYNEPRMQRCFPALLALLVSIPVFARAQNPTEAEIEKNLKQIYRGKTVALREFARAPVLEFDSDGVLVNRSRLAFWTLDGLLRVDKVKLRAAQIELDGRRVIAVYDREHDTFEPFTTSEKVRLRIANASTTAKQLQELLDKVFVADTEDHPRNVPEYVHSTRNHSVTSPGREALKVVKGTTPPRVVELVEPRFPTPAIKAKAEGTVVLWLILDEQGTVDQIMVARPLGKGLDEAAIDSVRRWRFEPAKKDGQPVAVQVNVEVKFILGERQSSW